jgi:hypothetical protein
VAAHEAVEQRPDLGIAPRDELELVECDEDRAIVEQLLQRGEHGAPVRERLLLVDAAA